jgi:hypothetical protein
MQPLRRGAAAPKARNDLCPAGDAARCRRAQVDTNACGPMMLDVLFKIKDEQDPALSFRRSCRCARLAASKSARRARARRSAARAAQPAARGGDGSLTALPTAARASAAAAR